MLAGASCPISLTGGEDQYYNPVPAPPAPARWWNSTKPRHRP